MAMEVFHELQWSNFIIRCDDMGTGEWLPFQSHCDVNLQTDKEKECLLLLIVIAFSLDSRDCGNKKPAGEMKVLWWVVHLIVTIIIVGGTVTCYDNNDENKTIETRGRKSQEISWIMSWNLEVNYYYYDDDGISTWDSEDAKHALTNPRDELRPHPREGESDNEKVEN